MMLPGLEGRATLVTGGSRGIGRATVLLLAGCGARVGLGYRSDRTAAAETVDLALAAGAPAAWSSKADLADPAGVEALFAESDRQFGRRLDVFVGNAGIWNERDRPLRELPPDEWREMIDANLTSIYLSTRAAAGRLGEGGRIILVTSTAAQRGEAGHSHYAASKGAIQSFVKSLAVELGPDGITVNAVAPGWVDTDMSASTLHGDFREAIEAEIPVRRIAGPSDIAGPIVFLASDLARHVNGEVLNVNGGSVLCG
jgi:3-oxoacyl-[acyl-carrier protein] reductase